MTAKTAAKTAKPAARKGMGNTADQPTTGTPVETTALVGVVATPPAPATTPRVAEIQATMAAKTAAAAARKAATKPAAKPAAAKPAASTAQAAAKAAKAQAASANSDLVLAFLTANAGTAYAVGDVEIGTNTGPRPGATGVKTQRPTLWALVEKGLVVATPTAAGRKGFMVPKPAAPARKATPRKAAASK